MIKLCNISADSSWLSEILFVGNLHIDLQTDIFCTKTKTLLKRTKLYRWQSLKSDVTFPGKLWSDHHYCLFVSVMIRLWMLLSEETLWASGINPAVCAVTGSVGQAGHYPWFPWQRHDGRDRKLMWLKHFECQDHWAVWMSIISLFLWNTAGLQPKHYYTVCRFNLQSVCFLSFWNTLSIKSLMMNSFHPDRAVLVYCIKVQL